MAKQLKDQPLPKGDYYSVTKKCPIKDRIILV